MEVIHFLFKENFQRWSIMIYLGFYIFWDFCYWCLIILNGPLWVPALAEETFAFVVAVAAVVTTCVSWIIVWLNPIYMNFSYNFLSFDLSCFAYVLHDVFTKKTLWMLEVSFTHKCMLATQSRLHFPPLIVEISCHTWPIWMIMHWGYLGALLPCQSSSSNNLSVFWVIATVTATVIKL